MTDNPEIRAKVLDWQRRYNIPDGDPALAIIDLLEIYYGEGISSRPQGSDPQAAAVSQMDDAALEQIRAQILPTLDRITFQIQELKGKMDAMALDTFVEQIGTYHEGIDYCTKKLDVVKRESDAVAIQIGKVANSINPISRMAVLALMVFSGVLGFLLPFIFK